VMMTMLMTMTIDGDDGAIQKALSQTHKNRRIDPFT